MFQYRIVGVSRSKEKRLDSVMLHGIKRLPEWAVSHPVRAIYFIAPNHTEVIDFVTCDEIKLFRTGVPLYVVTELNSVTAACYVLGQYMQLVIFICPVLRQIASVHSEFIPGGLESKPMTQGDGFFNLALYLYAPQLMKTMKPNLFDFYSNFCKSLAGAQCTCAQICQ